MDEESLLRFTEKKVSFPALEDFDLIHFEVAESDSDTIRRLVEYLTLAGKYFNVVVVTDFGGRSDPERSPGLVEQVVGAAFQTFGGVDPHPSPFDKAALLLRGITQGHPFADGNKRTGFLLASYYLRLAGYPPPSALPPILVVDFCTRISAGEIREIGKIAATLADLWHQPL